MSPSRQSKRQSEIEILRKDSSICRIFCWLGCRKNSCLIFLRKRAPNGSKSQCDKLRMRNYFWLGCRTATRAPNRPLLDTLRRTGSQSCLATTRTLPYLFIHSKSLFLMNWGPSRHPCQWSGHLKCRFSDTDGFHLPHTTNMSPPMCEITVCLTTRKRFQAYLFKGEIFYGGCFLGYSEAP